MLGIVYKSTGNEFLVKTTSKKLYKCKLKGRFRTYDIKSTNPVSVGDNVKFHVENIEQKTGVIYEIEKRKNYIIRKSVNLSKESHILASNIDCCFLFVTPSKPETTTTFIDRILVSTKSYNINTIILFNKVDLYTEKEKDFIKSLIKIYTQIGYECIEISSLQKINLKKIMEIMKDKVSIFTGHSGVGKSTLLNSLSPRLSIKTGNVSNQNKQGQHTTTFSQMYDLDFGAKIIDSPGIKGFGLYNIEKEEVKMYFPEFLLFNENCKFNNCLHLNEPNCAVKDNIKSGKISISRYESYLNIVKSTNNKYRINDLKL
ncbi:MAG: ribosome small subunit-dependent GTPase A [Flavobacteriaceae bacterium]|nr:ribosome small subunit-dependent GTPase A [Flavobacteriaceae bacterium]|tara:strand:- start:2236 stop:3180 length:945 start_codon:yes stop_codon:yes gene_type:complete